MSADFPSSNPFRRKAAATPASAPQSNPSTINHSAYQAADPQPGFISLENDIAPKKITKRVRVQSPPPLSPSTPSLPDSTSTIGEGNYSFSTIPPTPPIPTHDDDDPFDTITSDISDDDTPNKTNKAPANPFSRTLETMEHPQKDIPNIPPTNVTNPGRASMDVEAFKRLLMTGSSGKGTSTPPAAPVHVTHALGDGGSSTDASSVSRQSIFEAIQEPHPESPRTSHEISEPEDYSRRVAGEVTSTAGRKKPPPPSSRHGKLIRVELRDDASSTALQSPPTPASITSQSYFSSSPRSQTDLNKPLPPAPSRASHDSDRESIFDKESAGKTPEPPSPAASTHRKLAPAPPLARRHSQKVPDHKHTRIDTTRLSPKPEEESTTTLPIEENARPRSNSGRVPPPPPSRRIGSVRVNSSSSAQNAPLVSPSSISLPSPPPARGSNRSASGKASSVHSMDMSSTPVSNKRMSVMPPPPPPHRHGRTSLDGPSPGTPRRTSGDYPRRTSGDYPRRSMDIARRGSATSSIMHLPEEVVASPLEEPAGAGKHDILADLTKLQAEIDALRNRDNIVQEKVRVK